MSDPDEAPRMTRRSALAAAIALAPTALAWAQPRPANIRTLNGRVQLPDGRCLGYADCGNQSGPLVLYCHGLPGSRLEAALLADEAADCGVRLVAIDRPGIGLSGYQPGRRILDWPADAACVADALGYAGSAFGVIGFSTGAPYALSTVKCIADRLTHVAVVSGHAPMNAPGAGRGSMDDKIELIARRPRLAHIGIGVIIRQLHRNPSRVMQRVAGEGAPSDRQLLLGSSVNRSNFRSTLLAASSQGQGPIITDVQLLRRDWGYRLDALPPSSVSVWQGACDPVTPPAMGHYFHRHVAGSELFVDATAGHVTMLKWHAREILAHFA